MPVKDVRSMGWTQRNVAVTVLLAMEEHRKAAGHRVTQLREAQGLTQEDLAPRAKLSVKTISRFENGRHDGRRSTVRQIAEALGVSEADIIGDPPDPLGLSTEQDAQPDWARRIELKLDALLNLLAPDERAALAARIAAAESTP